jgi:phage terminase large subunit
VIRPAFSDRKGWAVFMGTPKGRNEFWDDPRAGEEEPAEWFLLELRASESGILDEQNLTPRNANSTQTSTRRNTSATLPQPCLVLISGGRWFRQNAKGGLEPLLTTSNSGLYRVGHWLSRRYCYLVVSGCTRGNPRHRLPRLERADDRLLYQAVKEKPYKYATHWLPHDARAKTLASGGKSISSS